MMQYTWGNIPIGMYFILRLQRLELVLYVYCIAYVFVFTVLCTMPSKKLVVTLNDLSRIWLYTYLLTKLHPGFRSFSLFEVKIPLKK